VRLAVLVAVALAGCSAIRPVGVPPSAPTVFSHADFDRVLDRFVDGDGRVDYAALQAAPQDLERYYALIAAYSPDSHPSLFPDRRFELAYWMNAYNAAVMTTVLAHYPITSVSDVGSPLFFVPRSGFFFFQRQRFGGVATNLYVLENRVIRKRYREPRVHFALNCASRGCPRLPRRAFSGAGLEAELDREARKFLGEVRNVRVELAAHTVHLSSIFDWYADDFLAWVRLVMPGPDATILDYVALYAPPEVAAVLRGAAASYSIHHVPYDWRLNDRVEAGSSCGT
jgi:hypothetical protein